MHTYLISCDVAVRDGVHDTAAIAGAIREIATAWARPLECTWYVKSPLPQAEIEARLGAHIGDGDGLLIQPVMADGVMLNTELCWIDRQRPRDVIGRPGRADAAGDPASPRRVLAFPAARARRPGPNRPVMASKP